MVAQQSGCGTLYAWQQGPVSGEVSNPELGCTALARTQEFPRASEFKIFLGDGKAIGRLAQRRKTFFSRAPKGTLIHQHTDRLAITPADASA